MRQVPEFVDTAAVRRLARVPVELRCTGLDNASPPSGYTPLPVANALGDGEFDVLWAAYSGRFGRNAARAEFTGRPLGIDHVIRAAAAYATIPHRGLYFHGATVVWPEATVLFVGASGAGKSTLCAEGAPERVICDEISIVEPTAGGRRWRSLASPFWGTLGYARRVAPAEIDAVALLSHGTQATTWQPVDGAQALFSVMPHMACQSAAQASHPDVLAALTSFVTALPVYRVAWLRGDHPLSGSPWSPSR